MIRMRFAALAAFAMSASVAAHGAPAQQSYIIEAAVTGDGNVDFVIDGNIYGAVGACPDWQAGDRVVFADGKVSARCDAVQLTNIDRDTTCELVCE